MLDDLQRDFSAEALSDLATAYEAFRPPRRVAVSQGVAETLYVKQPGAKEGYWDASETPYMVEPMDVLSSRRHEAVVFAGPARGGKTLGLIVGWMAHAVCNDPGDMMIVQMTQDKAREFSKTDIDRAIRHSPKLKERMGRSQDDNTHDKTFRNGMWLRIAWPTVSNLSGSTYRYVAGTDYDRWPDNIDGEGSGFDLMLKRTTTFMSRGMALAESSPGRPIEDPNWKPASYHEAPPVKGILGIYNRSDMRRWYWKCPHCGTWFEAKPGMDLFCLPDEEKLLELVREGDINELVTKYNRVVCPNSGCIITPSYKSKMNATGRWLSEGQRINEFDEVIGTARKSEIAGFWMGGVAATYQSWRSLISKYLLALRDYALTGAEDALQKTINTDQGMPYMSRLLAAAQRAAKDPRDRKNAGLQRYIVPDWTRFVTAQVDVQGGQNPHFAVQIHAHGPHNEQAIVDRYALKESMREGIGGMAPLDPAIHPEDWDVLTEKVIKATYRTSTEGKNIRVKLTVIDTGGEHLAKMKGQARAEGVTEKAYAWYRRLRRLGLHHRVRLTKGASAKDAPLIRESLVGARNPKEKGDVPLYTLNTNILKDTVSTGLKRTDPGPGYIHLPAWPPASFFDELEAEVRNADGTWTKIRKRNETLDLCMMAQAARLMLGADKINWQRPPEWARPLDDGNTEIVTREERAALRDEEDEEAPVDASVTSQEPAAPSPPPAPPPAPIPTRAQKAVRRTVRFGYLR